MLKSQTTSYSQFVETKKVCTLTHPTIGRFKVCLLQIFLKDTLNTKIIQSVFVDSKI